MHILDRKKATSIKGVSKDGRFFRKEKIKGFYYIKYPFKNIWRDSDVEIVIETDRKVGINSTASEFNEIIERYLIETEIGWYSMYVSKPEPKLVKNIAESVNAHKVEPYIKLFIREEAELNLIEKDSYIFKLYTSKYGNKKFRDAEIDIYTLG